jgi:FMN phosphatase YigB (HAD superfamily)
LIRAILFDLDGTLLQSDMNVFMPHYLQALTTRLAHLIPPTQLSVQLMRSTRLMMANTDPTRTNQQVFDADFYPKIGHSREEMLPILEEFYTHDFAHLRDLTQPKPEARPLVQAAFARGYDVAIATQPVFPLVAVRQRLEWAGVADFPYRLVTSYENMHACKPQPAFFQEVLAVLGRSPGECLFAGDSPWDDIAPAAQLGLHTFWVTDAAPDPVDPTIPARWRGGLGDLHRLIVSGELDKPM